MSIRQLKWAMLGLILAVSVLSHGYGAEWPLPPRGQPVQIKTQVRYDPDLSDPFFETDEWTTGKWVYERVNGRDVDTPQKCRSGKDKSDCFKITARCISSLDVWRPQHPIQFCEAKLLDGGRIGLLINDPMVKDLEPCDQYLLIEVKGGVFWSQYWCGCEWPTAGMTWTTKKQELTLDKRVYRKGDVIKGRIVFECMQNYTDSRRGVRSPIIIKVNGVFKTVLK